MKLLVANRGEIAIRVLRAAADLGVPSVAVASQDDASSLHLRLADEIRMLPGDGPAAYLDGETLVAAALDTGCDALHPGYGFLSESAAFARQCETAGLVFIGPRPETLEQLGDKTAARALAESAGIPVLRGANTLEEARTLLATLDGNAAIMVKAVAGGGGRGMRRVERIEALEEAWERCASEAKAAFGHGALYAERFFDAARHIEIQIVGDAQGHVRHLFERECSLQRRHQKLVEIAPSPSLAPGLRERLGEAAVRLGSEVGYLGLGTIEFLVEANADSDAPEWAFIEANARLQVEHTVTEAITGLDLVQLQLRLAEGATLDELELGANDVVEPRGYALQVRINTETLGQDGALRPTGGTLSVYEMPSGPGLRVDGYAYAGYTTNARFDSLLAKLIAHSPSREFDAVVRRAARGLDEVRIEGVTTNLALLRSLLAHPEVIANRVTTRFVESRIDELLQHAPSAPDKSSRATSPRATVGARLDTDDPLAVLHHGKSAATGRSPAPSVTSRATAPAQGPPGTEAVLAPLQGTIISVDVAQGDAVHEGQSLLVMEAMKMEHVVVADRSGIVRSLAVAAGDTISEAHPLLFLEPADVGRAHAEDIEEVDLDHIRPDLAEVQERHALGFDAARPEAVERRRKTGQRTARENIADLCDEGSFIEYGPVVIAAQRRRRALDDLIRNTPADGMVAGVGSVNCDLFGDDASRCVLMSYDYTVLAGTQGMQNHRKKDRMFELAASWRVPLVLFSEGGGGRPGDTDGSGVAGLDCMAFVLFGRLSGLVPLVGINSGRCFAGNAALLGCCDVVIATENSNIGMGGPAMIEGGGLGIFRPDEVGPMDVQVPNGVVDIAVADETEAVQVARQYLSYFQGATSDWECADQRLLRSTIPENRLRIYDVRGVIETLADTSSVLELRRGFGHGMVTALARVEGRPVGIVANNPTHLAGAIDSPGADKAVRFMQLCDAFDLPILFLCDTPGIMVGPESEKTALVRHASRMFVTGASLTVPFFTIVLRKGYGLGAQAMAGGSFKAPFFTVAWPTGEFGGMGLEGAVKLGFRKELAAENDPEQRRELYETMVARMYEHGKAINMASHFEIDEVIDPADSRHWIARALRSVPPVAPRQGKKRPCIDAW
ncbi:MAG: carbamoyl-phosphate synthase large subunit [Deltaproteobacteria bacterium]|nr:carbamoyl-phosphate synthase large subunit [Deltaproteobacteria bacterium]